MAYNKEIQIFGDEGRPKWALVTLVNLVQLRTDLITILKRGRAKL